MFTFQITWSPWTILLSLLFLLFVQVVRRTLLTPLRSIPGPFLAKISSLWLVSQCRRVRRSEAVIQQHRKYGDFVRIAPNHISIASPQALKEIYGHKTGFIKGPFYDAFLQGEPVLFNMRNQPAHQRRRKHFNPAFSPSNLKAFEPEVTKSVMKLKECLFRVADCVDSSLDFSRHGKFPAGSNFLAFDVIADYAFGQTFGFLEKEKDYLNLISTVDSRGEVLNALGHVSPWLRPAMKYNVFDQFWHNGLRATGNLEAIGRQAYFRRKSQQNPRKDLLSFLFNSKDPDTNQKLPEELIIAESISFIVGGSDTTSTSMTHFIDFVSRDPGLQKRLQEEMDAAFPEVSDEWVADFAVAEKLPILLATFRETMRIRPTSATGLERITPPEGKVVAGRLIPGGTMVSVTTRSIFSDPRIFKNPEAFDVDRWLQPDSGAMLEYFNPFSLGPRSCIGRNFAWTEVIKTLATLLRTFEFKRLSDKPTELREGFFVKVTECMVKVSRRQDKI
ncbi:FAD linked oxidase domain containing protein [Zalerion maritima]|uniref:FAD linked oxidase domain containing protein n=1 Tax=Zalerion maritima TaxID=339359 RepID=A0AAD5WRC6_9PEZI|nr:FAD linked oxidase domain containing protein [Zalerion maritima]